LEYEDLDFSAFTHLNFRKVYVEQLDITINTLFKVSSLQQLFRTIQINDDLLDDEIIITDYQADLLIQNNITLNDSYEDLINTYIQFGNYSFKIKNVLVTNYQKDGSTIFQDKMLTTYDVL